MLLLFSVVIIAVPGAAVVAVSPTDVAVSLL